MSDIDQESTQRFHQERWCNQVAAELLVPIEEFRAAYDSSVGIRKQLEPLAKRFFVSKQVILGQLREIGALTWEQFMKELELEKDKTIEIISGQETGGNFYYSKPVQVSKRFARELITSTLEGQTTYSEAFRLLNINKMSTFEGIGQQLGVL